MRPFLRRRSPGFLSGSSLAPGRHDVEGRRVAQTMASPGTASTAGIIVIGDEILKGQTADTNSCFLCRRLFSLGVKVKKISVIGDELDVIAEEVAKFSHCYTHVFTSGGVGPTHDDLTFEGVAKAFDEPVEPHPELIKLCTEYFHTTDLSSPKMKMAFVPRSAKLLFCVDKKTGEKSKFPLVSLCNVYMFPGIPSLLKQAFTMMEDIFKNPSKAFFTKEVFVSRDEINISDLLNNVDEKFKKYVQLGSYPDFHSSYYKVKLTLESEFQLHLEEAHQYLIKSLPEGSLVTFESDPVGHAVEQVYSIVESDKETDYVRDVRQAVNVIEECLNKYKLSEVCVGFNGGKDCTALLHLFYAIAKRKFPDYKENLLALYIQSISPFPEVEKFIQVSRDCYRLQMLQYHGRIQNSLKDLLHDHPEIKAVLMGTRLTDPYSKHLESFTMTDPDWPQIMRVSPLLCWNYTNVWTFLRSLCLPYCSLYDQGYTSLGSMNDTHPNPHLQYIDKRGVVCYKPAYQLEEDEEERAGRNVHPKAKLT